MYVVIENTPGYLPDADEPATFETLTEARRYARELVRELRDLHADIGDGCRVRVDSTSAPRAWYVDATRDPHDLGRVVEIVDAEPEL